MKQRRRVRADARDFLSELQVADFQRLFRVRGLPYLIDDIWMDHYKARRCLVTVVDGHYTSYMPRAVMEQTLAEGVALFGKAAAFKQYEQAFRQYLNDGRAASEQMAAGTFDRVQLQSFLNFLAGIFSYYEKTEFFFTDRAYEQAKHAAGGWDAQWPRRLGELKYWSRDVINGLFLGSQGYLPRVVSRLARRFNLDSRGLMHYGRGELLSLYEGQRVPAAEVERRAAGFMMLGRGDQLDVLTGWEAVALIVAFERSRAAQPSTRTLTGIVAHPGTVRGRVRVIPADYGDFDSLADIAAAMRQGEVLVAETTSPELMPACRKAAAIVTDQGGLLSHAAIVSRELNIPCIVGTKHATALLKNGDEVEVDALRRAQGKEGAGVVKILRRV